MISAEGDSGVCVLVLADGGSAPVSNPAEGRFRWNTTLNQLEYSENGGPWTSLGAGGGDSSILTCPATVNLNDAVAITGSAAVDKADASNAANRPAVGIVVSKPAATSCVVRYSGELSGFVGLTPGATYFLASGTPGAIVSTPPSGGSDIRQVVGTALTASILIVDIERDVLQLSP